MTALTLWLITTRPVLKELVPPRLLASITAALVTVLDGHPAAHAWLGSVRGQKVVPLGVDRFGQAGDIPDLYREYGLDEAAILDAAAQALVS